MVDLARAGLSPILTVRSVYLAFLLVTLSLAAGSVAWADANMTTYTYKKVGGLEIRADVYRDPAMKPDRRPVLMWIHGGALIMGGRGNRPRFAPALSAAGIVMVSIDYRLAPETRLPEIIGDVGDAYRWIHERGPDLLEPTRNGSRSPAVRPGAI